MTRTALLHVVGARPNFMKAGPVIKAAVREGLTQACVHTGQHYDRTMSKVFFHDLDLPEPDMNLGVGSGTQAGQTAALLMALEDAVKKIDPDLVVVYGDVNSTLAGALVAAKLQIPIAHVEAGLRSFDNSMPEEINRRVADQLSELLFVTSPEAIANLANEGVPTDRIHFVGNPMIDTLLANLDRFDPSRVRDLHDFGDAYGVVTLHRPANVDHPDTAARLTDALRAASEQLPLVFPVHPRGRQTLQAAGVVDIPALRVVDPLGYLDFLSLVRGARAVITDSGGIQEETTVLKIPCLTLRSNTERPITITHGTNRLVTAEGLSAALVDALRNPTAPAQPPPLWDGKAGDRMARILAGALR